jgi:signal transduction histidine kinase
LGLLTLEAVDLEKLITKNVDSLQSDVIHSNFKIENEINSSRWVLGVAAYLDSVILNLLTNAIKYKRDCEQSELRIKSYFEGEYSVFEFIDNGLGIDMDKNGNDIFKLYKTFHDNKDSRGIGLFITKNQIEIRIVF